MDTKIEPGDELLSSVKPEKAYHDDNHSIKTEYTWSDEQSLEINYEALANQEFKSCVPKDENIKQEYDIELRNYKHNANEDGRPFKVEQLDVVECPYAERTPDKNIKQEDDIELQNYKSSDTENRLPFKVELFDLGECPYAERSPDQIPTIKVEASSPKTSDNLLQPNLHNINSSFPCNNYQVQSDFKQDLSNKDKIVVIMLKKNEFYEQNFVCSACFHIFPTSHSLSKHVHVHKSKTDKLNKFLCNECDFSASYPSLLRMHKMSHTGEKPFKCDQCQFKTAQAFTLKNHKITHTGEKPFECDQCNYKAARSSSIKVHKMSHTGEKPFKCDLCNYKCSRLFGLKMHKMKHSGEKPFKCDICDYKTTRPLRLKNHKNKHTGKKT